MTNAKIALIVLSFGLALGTVAAFDLPAAESGSAPAATSSVEPTTTPPPASPATVRDSLEQRAHAQRALHRYLATAECYLRSPDVQLWPRPQASDCDDEWLRAGQRWQLQERDYKLKAGRLLQGMRHPGGSSNGVRWKPLARWVGWPEYALGTLTGMIWYESSGRERAHNDVIGCTGLTQIWPAHVTKRTGMSWAAATRWLMVAENNLREALRIFREQHNSFLPAWRGDPAVGW